MSIRLHAKYLFFLSDFKDAHLIDRSWKNIQMRNFLNIRPVRAEFFQANRQMDRHDKAVSGFWQILRDRLKITVIIRQSD
jgi:hypothetical protein